jgi:proline-specific peptidase
MPSDGVHHEGAFDLRRGAMRSAGLATRLVGCLVAIAIVAGCAPHRISPGEGFVLVPGGRVWWRIIGHGSRTPLLVLHGGPGASSLYLKPLEALADERPVVFYDQLGGGQSDRPDDNTLWTTEHFVAELARVRQKLGLTKVHLYGHSWGSMIATDYMLTKPKGVQSLILAGPALSVPRWEKDAAALLATLPDSVQTTLVKLDNEKKYDSPEYQAATMVFYGMYMARRQPWSPELQKAFGDLNQTVYNYMQGPSEFKITGTLKNYDRTPRLHEITVHTLFLSGQYDEAVPATVEYYKSLVPGAEIAIIPDAGHMAMQDEPEKYVQVLREFLRKMDAQ